MRTINVAIVEDESSSAALLQKEVTLYGQEKGLVFAFFLFASAEKFMNPTDALCDLIFLDVGCPGAMVSTSPRKSGRRTRTSCLSSSPTSKNT